MSPSEATIRQTAPAAPGAAAAGPAPAAAAGSAGCSACAAHDAAAHHLLAAVADAAHQLLAVQDFDRALHTAFGILGRTLQAPRLGLVQDLPAPGDERPGRWQVTHEWFRPGLQAQVGSALGSGDYPSPDWWRCVVSGEIVVVPNQIDPPDVAAGSAILAVPVPHGGGQRWWLAIGFEAWRVWSDTQRSALRAAAACVGAALQRRDAEVERLVMAQRRADRSERHARLLGAVAGCAEDLLAAPDLAACMDSVLQRVGQVTEADRACLGLIEWLPDDPVLHGRQWMTHEWTAPGAVRQIDSPHQHIELRRDDPSWEMLIERMRQHGHVLAEMSELDEPFRSSQEALGVKWALSCKLEVGGVFRGLLGFDYATPFDRYDGADLAALKTVASNIAQAMHRRELEQRTLAAEQRRFSELARANEALRLSLDALADAQGEAAFVRQSLLQIHAQSGARSVYLFADDEPHGPDGSPRLLGRVTGDGFSTALPPGDPPLARWPHSPGHRAHTLHALTVGRRQVGVVGMVFAGVTPPLPAQQDLIHTLCQPLTLALELARLARLARAGAERAAVLGERERLAREIHDGIAQSFLAIQMQLGALDDRAPPPLAQWTQARELARHGLNEARRAVAALRPHELLNRDLPTGLARLLAQMTAGSGLRVRVERPAQWRRLAPEVEDHLFRIVQEAVNNVLKHARARTLRVELSQAAGAVSVLVADDGVGFDTLAAQARTQADAGFGLDGMQQRARLIGAELACFSGRHEGTQILVSLALPAGSQHKNKHGETLNDAD